MLFTVFMDMRCVLLAGVLLAPCLRAGDPLILDRLMPDAQVVAGVNVGNLMASPLGQNLPPDVRNFRAEWRKLVPNSPIDPFHDVREVIFASAGAATKPPVLVILHGTFDLSRFTAGSKTCQGVPCVVTKEGVFAFLDRSTAVAGEMPVVNAALRRRERTGSLDASLRARVVALRAIHDVWGVGRPAPGLIAQSKELGNPVPVQAFEKVERFEFGIKLTEGMEISADLLSRSEKDAQQMATAIEFITGMMARQKHASGVELPRVRVKAEGRSLHLAVSVPPHVIQQAMTTHGKQLGSMAVGASASAAPPKDAAPRGDTTPVVHGSTPAPAAGPEAVVVKLPAAP